MTMRLIFKLKKNVISDNLLSTLSDFLKLRKQKVVLNSQMSSWSSIEAGAPQGSAFGTFVIYYPHIRTFRWSDDKCQTFSAVDNINLSATNFNSDLCKINAWENQFKMVFNPNKQEQEVIFSRKLNLII